MRYTLSNKEQKTWNDKAAAEMGRQSSELNDYKGPWKLPSPDAATPVEGCPKRPPSAFVVFSKDRREVMRTAANGATEAEIDRIVNLQWTNLSEEEKSVYLNQENGARQEYKTKMQEWRKQCAAKKEADHLQRQGAAT